VLYEYGDVLAILSMDDEHAIIQSLVSIHSRTPDSIQDRDNIWDERKDWERNNEPCRQTLGI
jgi:hypothetical protein